MGVIGVSSGLEVSFAALQGHAVSEDHADEEKCPIRSERMLDLRRVTLREVSMGIHGFIEDAIMRLATKERQNGTLRTDKQLEVMLQDIVTMAFDEKMRAVI